MTHEAPELPFLGRGDFIPAEGLGAGGTPPPTTLLGDNPEPDTRASAYLARSLSRDEELRPASGEPPRRPWHLRRLSSRLSGHRGHRWCGRIPTGSEVGVRRSLDGSGRATGRARFVNVQTCGQLWECAVCRTAELTERGARLVASVREHRERGGETYLLSLTMRRPEWGPSLAHCLYALGDAWSSLQDSAVWRELRTIAPRYVRALEVTDGSRGWHAHYHVLIYCDKPLSDFALDIWRMRIASRWAHAVDAHAGTQWRPRLDSVGCDLRPCTAARYLSKLGLELANATSKEGRDEHRLSQWQLLERTAHADVATRRRAVARWREYVETMHKRKCIQASDMLADDMGRVRLDEHTEVEVAQLKAATYRRLSARPEWLEVIARCADEARLADVESELRNAGVRPMLAHRARVELTSTALDREREWGEFIANLTRAYARGSDASAASA